MALRIGELAGATGTTAPTIRYYEQIGLLPHPRRVGGQRRYDDDDVRRVTFIRRCRDLDFSVEQVRALVELTHDADRSCVEARDLAELHLTAVRAKLADLRTLESRIAELIVTSKADCDGRPATECVVLEGLSRPCATTRVTSPDFR
ncbi:MerR family transcriptional regulator [Mycobacterium paraseoulense]|uniref:MerR family transcriptional regulator n=1 Tax=Mycobacterium paraseoulense TaxID=590652 RepID=A0A1X0ICZ3_9MYCO|nr:MerR family transcriptional regulator [Mycobacterium paraseoulense]MCV7394537.1 MerR family transcriptional regulator [Mycobacterium paraseoulense]ORB42320.1 MerR family transcriptional regulator [Mycobacterium paraseoulense]